MLFLSCLFGFFMLPFLFSKIAKTQQIPKIYTYLASVGLIAVLCCGVVFLYYQEINTPPELDSDGHPKFRCGNTLLVFPGMLFGNIFIFLPIILLIQYAANRLFDVNTNNPKITSADDILDADLP